MVVNVGGEEMRERDQDAVMPLRDRDASHSKCIWQRMPLNVIRGGTRRRLF